MFFFYLVWGTISEYLDKERATGEDNVSSITEELLFLFGMWSGYQDLPFSDIAPSNVHCDEK